MQKINKREAHLINEFLYYINCSLRKGISIGTILYILTERLNKEKMVDLTTIPNRKLIEYMRDFYPEYYGNYLDLLDTIHYSNIKNTTDFTIIGMKYD